MSELKLFPDSETFSKTRPEKLQQAEADAFWLEMANEVIDQRWSQSDPEDIADDLKKLYMSDSGFEMAKDLEDGEADYAITGDFITWLEDLWYRQREALNKVVMQWVKARNPQHLFAKGQALEIKEFINHELKSGQTIYVTGIKEETATYLVWPEKEHAGGYILPFEKVEAHCIPLP